MFLLPSVRLQTARNRMSFNPLRFFNAARDLRPVVLLAISGILTCCHTLGQASIKYQITGPAVPGTNIRCISGDPRKFLWVGTQDGLLRYDSRNTREFNQRSGNGTNIGGSDIRDICIWKDRIWVASSQGGLNAIEPGTSTVNNSIPQERFPGLGSGTISSITHADRYLYIGTDNGIFQYDEVRKIITAIPVSSEVAPIPVDKLVYARGYLIVFIRNRGCISIDCKTGRIADTINTLRACHVNAQRFYNVSSFEKNSWLAGTSAGLHKIQLLANGQLEFTPIAFPGIATVTQQDVYAVTTDGYRQTWFSTENNLFRIDSNGKQCYIVDNAIQDVRSGLDNIYSLYCDNDNGIWLGSMAGLFYLKNMPAPTITYTHSENSNTFISDAYCIYPDNDSTVYLAGENFLYKINTNTRNIDEIDHTQAYDFIFRDPFGKLLASNKKGLQNLEGKVLHPVYRLYPEFRQFSDYTINSAVLLNQQELLMGTENYHGVLVWNFKQHQVHAIDTTTGALQLDNNSINTVVRLRENVSCILTETSLFIFDRAANTLRRVALKKANGPGEYGLFFDMCRIKDRYYLSTYGNGLLVLDNSFRITGTITTTNGLSNNSIYKLLPYGDSLLFITTNHGLSMLNVNTGRLRRLYKSDGLHDDVFEETSGCTYKNIIFAGGRNGLTAIYPDHITTNGIAPSVYINKVSLLRQGNVTNDYIDLNKSVFVVPSDAIQVKLFFCGINFSNPNRTQFAYKIKELPSDWIDLGTQDILTLTGMPPGTYHLLVKAANEDGYWSDPKEIMMEFQPRWYQTAIFKIFIMLLGLSVAYGFYRLRIHQIRKQQEIRKNVSSDLHDSIGSSLTSVNVLLNLALNSPTPKTQLENIKESVSEATSALRDLIWILDDTLDSVEGLISRLKQYAAPVCHATNIQLQLNIEPGAGYIKLTKKEKRNLLLICKEAINNSIKYAEASVIGIEIPHNSEGVIIKIHDNGKGFAPSVVTKGYGLNNIRYRASQIRYNASIDSQPGKGTTVYISPL